MRRVDFLGAPGVGKSTLYRALRARRGGPRNSWITPGEARIAVAFGLASEGGWRKRLATVGLRVPRVREFLAERILASGADRALRASRTWGDLLEAWEEAFSESSLPATERVLTMLPWARRTAELALFAEKLGGRAVVFDESYTKLACGTLTMLGSSSRRVTAFFRRGPPPAALVWIKDPEPERVAPRLVRRLEGKRPRDASGRLRFADRWWPDAELVAYVGRRMGCDADAVRVLQERGVPVHEVNVSEPLPGQAAGVESFLAAVSIAASHSGSGVTR